MRRLSWTTSPGSPSHLRAHIFVGFENCRRAVSSNGHPPQNPLDEYARHFQEGTNHQAQHQTLHLYHPSQVADLTPCTLHLNVLPTELASGLLRSLLLEATEWKANRFRLFERVVQTKSSSCLYVDRMDPLSAKEYVYNGSKVFTW